MAESFSNDQTVRWCPGCGDYAVLKHLQHSLEQLNYSPDQVVVISGIGCAARLPYYLSCYGFHTIHGRAPSIATGVAVANPELPVIIITGDGDGLSIGLHHLLHLMRRNVNVTVILMNNRVYGLTKGQASPTSNPGQITKTSLAGVQEQPFCPLTLGLAAGATFLGRCFDIHGLLLQRLIKESLSHQGTSFIEVYQNCPIFNDGAFSHDGKHGQHPQLCTVWPGEPIVVAGGRTLNYQQEGWQLIEGETSFYEGSKLQAQQLLEIQHVLVTGLFYQQQRPIFSVPRSDKPLKGSFDRACSSLLSWSLT